MKMPKGIEHDARAADAKRRRLGFRMIAVLAALGLIVAACGTDADPVAEEPDEPEAAEPADEPEEAPEPEPEEGPLAGELVTFLVGYGEGGGYDQYSRMLAPYIAEELGADIVVQNMPGAGGLLATNHIYGTDPDGTNFMIANGPGLGGAVLSGEEGVEFELGELSFIGRVAAEPRLFIVGADTPYETIEDVVAADGFRFGSSGPGSTYTDPLMIMTALGFDADIITGYDGSGDIMAGIAAGEVDGLVATYDSLLPAVESGDMRALLVVADERTDELPDVPVILDLDLDPDGEAVATTLLSVASIGRVMISSPGLPDEILQALRDALENVLTDEEFLAEAESQGRPIHFLPGAEVDDFIANVVDAPASVIEALRE